MSDVNCRHCGKRILRINWALGPGWTHVGGGSLCEHLRATPPPNTCPCGWVGEGECPRDLSDHTEAEQAELRVPKSHVLANAEVDLFKVLDQMSVGDEDDES